MWWPRAEAVVSWLHGAAAVGGTAAAAAGLIERLGGEVAGIALLIEIGFLDGRSRLPGRDIHALVTV